MTTAVVQWNHSSPQATAAGDLPLSQNFPGQGKQLLAGGEHQDSPKQLKSSQLLSLVAKPKDSEDKEVTAAVSPTASSSTRLSSAEDGSKDSIDNGGGLACLTVVEDANEKDDSGCRNNDCDIEGSEEDVQVARGWSGPGCVMTNTNSAPAADPTSLPALPGEVTDIDFPESFFSRGLYCKFTAIKRQQIISASDLTFICFSSRCTRPTLLNNSCKHGNGTTV